MKLSCFTGALILQVGTQAGEPSQQQIQEGARPPRQERRSKAFGSQFPLFKVREGTSSFCCKPPSYVIKHDAVSTSAVDFCTLSFSVVVSPSLFLFHFLISPGHQHTHFKKEVRGLAESSSAHCQHCGKLCCRAGEGPASAPKGWELAQLLTSVPFLQ